jgi:hypothetical protein
MPAHKHLQLKKNFHVWVDQVNRDFELVLNSNELEMINESISKSLSIPIDEKVLATILGLVTASPVSLAKPTRVNEPSSKPWLEV